MPNWDDPRIGLSWGEFGDGAKWGFQNVVHPLGKGLASGFGFGSQAQQLENFEKGKGLLPSDKPKPAPEAPPSGGPSSAPGGAAAASPSAPSHALAKREKSGGGALAWLSRHPVVVPVATIGVAGLIYLLIRLVRRPA